MEHMALRQEQGLVVLAASTALCVGYTLGSYYPYRKMKYDVLKVAKKFLGGILGWSTGNDNLEYGHDGPESNKICLAIVVRSDLTNDLSKLVDISSRTLLGQFKKLYKRRDIALRQWEETSGHAMTVYTCSSQDVLTSVQSAARALAVPTHTFVNKTPTHGKSRSAIVVGPVHWDKLQDIVGKLERI